MSNSSSNESPKKLANELGELVDFLADGPEFQGELKLPHDGELSPDELPTSSLDDLNIPVLTVKVGQSEKGLSEKDIEALVEDLVSLVLPKFETEIRLRLRKKISDLTD